MRSDGEVQESSWIIDRLALLLGVKLDDSS